MPRTTPPSEDGLRRAGEALRVVATVLAGLDRPAEEVEAEEVEAEEVAGSSNTIAKGGSGEPPDQVGKEDLLPDDQELLDFSDRLVDMARELLAISQRLRGARSGPRPHNDHGRRGGSGEHPDQVGGED